MDGLEELYERASSAAADLGSAIASGKQIRIVSHNDVDGICSGTLALAAVRTMGGSAHLGFYGHLYREELTDLLALRPDFLLFCDMASDHIPILRRSKVPYLVLDHHPTRESDERMVNPWEFSVDGTRQVSAAGVVYLVARALNPENVALSPIALCGAFGDMQGVEGANERIAAEAEGEGLAEEKKEIRLIGRVDRPVEYSITYSTLPFIKGLSGDPLAVRAFLSHLGIDPDPKASISELDPKTSALLIKGLAERMVKEDASTFEAEKLFGTTFHLPKMAAPTIDDVVDYVEACSALEEYSLAASFLLGDPAVRDEVEKCRLRYKERIFEGVGLFSSAKHLENLDFLVLEGWTELSGKLSSIYANAGFSKGSKPVFALNIEEDHIKVSARVNPQLVKRGIDLGRALSVVSEKFGGSGGGHNVAAGARIPKQHMDPFIKALNQEIGLQLESQGEEGEEG